MRLARLRGLLESRLRRLSLRMFGTTTIDELGSVELLPSLEYSVTQFGMSQLQQETYKYPVAVVTDVHASNGLIHGPFRFATLPDAYLAGNGRVIDRRGRLVLDSVASHAQKAGNPGWFRMRTARHMSGVYLNLNWWPGTGNFYHWNRDVLSRAFVLRSLPESLTVNLVAPTELLQYQAHSLDRLSMMFPNSQVVKQPLDQWWRVSEVLVPSQAPYLVGSGYLHPDVADFVRDVNMVDTATPSSVIPYLYVSRAKSRHRRIRDEDSLLRKLTERFPITVVHLEDLTVAEQLVLMKSAEVLIGPYGAGLTHVLFTKRKGLVELHNGDSKETHFATLALGCRCPYEQVNGGPSDERQDFAMTEAGITRVVEAVQRVADRHRR